MAQRIGKCVKLLIHLIRGETMEENYEPNEPGEWMHLSNLHAASSVNQNHTPPPECHDWQESIKHYSEEQIVNIPSWIYVQKDLNSSPEAYVAENAIDITSFNKEQSNAYSIVFYHYVAEIRDQLLLIITGIGGSGKSYLINAFRNLLRDICKITTFLGVAAFNVKGCTLHRLLQLPIRSKRCGELNGNALQKLQTDLEEVQYLVIDELSVIGQKMFEICYGFEVMVYNESVNVPFDVLYTRFPEAPKTCNYDNACSLHEYALPSRPQFFKRTWFLVDRLHRKNYVGKKNF
eukprot:gene1070-407_t